MVADATHEQAEMKSICIQLIKLSKVNLILGSYQLIGSLKVISARSKCEEGHDVINSDKSKYSPILTPGFFLSLLW